MSTTIPGLVTPSKRAAQAYAVLYIKARKAGLPHGTARGVAEHEADRVRGMDAQATVARAEGEQSS